MAISNYRAVGLFLRMNKGDSLTDKEQRLLSEVKELDLSTDLRTKQINSLKGLGSFTKLQSLDLSYTQVSSLNELSGLINLKTLNLRGTKVRSLDGLRELTKLETLNLSGTEVTTLDVCCYLKKLQSLDLSNTSINYWDCLSKLTQLLKLNLSYSQVRSLECIRELRKLKTLNLSYTQVRSRSLECIRELRNLETLNLSYTQVSSLNDLSGLMNLKTLNLRRTKVRSLRCIKELRNLETLDLQETEVSSLEELALLDKLTKLCISKIKISSIPQWLIARELSFYPNEENGGKKGVYMKDVQLSEQPVSLFSQSRELIEAYYKEAEPSPLNEAKVIFLGDGGVGKTYSIYRITHKGKQPPSLKTTPGVNITPYECEGSATNINFWDFGGQEIMYSMHRCFLTERTCYVVTVTNRWSEVMRQARRWLKNIECFAPDSRVILAVNLWEGVSYSDLDIDVLRTEFTKLTIDKVEYNAADRNGDGIQKLKESIKDEVGKLPSVKAKVPKSWKEIMEKVRNMTDDSGKSLNYITKEQYQKICEDAKLKDPRKTSDELLDWFNCLGVCFSYHKNAKDGSKITEYMILKPEWLTNAVYIIVNNCQGKVKHGCITYEDILRVLNHPQIYIVKKLKYNQDELRYLLEVMRKFRLSFELPEKREFVPALCPNKTPDNLRPKNSKLHVRCEVRYDYLPDSVVHRLMCDCSEDLRFERCWLKGLYIRDPYGLHAVCEMSKDDGVLYVDVYQVEEKENPFPLSPQWLLRSLLNKIERINNEYDLKSTTWICSHEGKATFRLEFLLDALKKGATYVPAPNSEEYKLYETRRLISQVFDESFKEEISESNETEIEELFLKKLVDKKEIYLMLQNFVHIENSNVATGGGTAYNPGVMIKAEGEARVNNAINSIPELSKQLEEFRNALNKQSVLTPDQKEDLSDALNGLIGSLDNSEEEQSKWKKMVKNAVKRVGNSLYSVIENAASAVVASYLQGYLPPYK